MSMKTAMKVIELGDKAASSVSDHTKPSPQAGEVLITICLCLLDVMQEMF